MEKKCLFFCLHCSRAGQLIRHRCQRHSPFTICRSPLNIRRRRRLHRPYSFDARTSKFEKGSHWVDESLSGRAYFQVAAEPASLTIESTKDSDSGTYRCRVDFHKSPTRNARVQLKIISKYSFLSILIRSADKRPKTKGKRRKRLRLKPIPGQQARERNWSSVETKNQTEAALC